MLFSDERLRTHRVNYCYRDYYCSSFAFCASRRALEFTDFNADGNPIIVMIFYTTGYVINYDSGNLIYLL
jgi:hypothetical protein